MFSWNIGGSEKDITNLILGKERSSGASMDPQKCKKLGLIVLDSLTHTGK